MQFCLREKSSLTLNFFFVLVKLKLFALKNFVCASRDDRNNSILWHLLLGSSLTHDVEKILEESRYSSYASVWLIYSWRNFCWRNTIDNCRSLRNKLLHRTRPSRIFIIKAICNQKPTTWLRIYRFAGTLRLPGISIHASGAFDSRFSDDNFMHARRKQISQFLRYEKVVKANHLVSVALVICWGGSVLLLSDDFGELEKFLWIIQGVWWKPPKSHKF